MLEVKRLEGVAALATWVNLELSDFRLVFLVGDLLSGLHWLRFLDLELQSAVWLALGDFRVIAAVQLNRPVLTCWAIHEVSTTLQISGLQLFSLITN